MTTIDRVIADLGFELLQDRRGMQRFARRSNPYLQWWLTLHADGTGELTWEFELGAYLKAKGFAVSAQDELSLLAFPAFERRGPADSAWLRNEVDGAERLLASVDFATGS